MNILKFKAKTLFQKILYYIYIIYTNRYFHYLIKFKILFIMHCFKSKRYYIQNKPIGIFLL